MLKKFILDVAKKILLSEQKKQQTVKLSEEDKVRKEAYDQLRQLYSFVQFVNQKVFRNRAERKNFWRNVENGTPALESTIQNIMTMYLKEKKVTPTSPVATSTLPVAKVETKCKGDCQCHTK